MTARIKLGVAAALLGGAFMVGKGQATPTVARTPPPAAPSGDPLEKLPEVDPSSPRYPRFQIELQGRDLSKLDLRNHLEALMLADFDTKTRWPAVVPVPFDPERFMELAKDPGLGVRSLHAGGITGRGVGIGIIDMALLVEHQEYRERLRLYEEIPPLQESANMHGPAVASIAVGKTVGVAPEANLYYIATSFTAGRHYEPVAGFEGREFKYAAQAIHRFLDLNKTLPRPQCIRVISMSIGWDKREDGYAEIMEAVERARREGVFVISTSIDDTHHLYFHGLGRDPGADPNRADSYGPGSWWKRWWSKGDSRDMEVWASHSYLLAPMDCRCTAAPTGNQDYVFYHNCGWSWTVPYISGLYALCCQVQPDITPEDFWQAALDTGDIVEVNSGDRKRAFGMIVNPPRLLQKVSK